VPDTPTRRGAPLLALSLVALGVGLAGVAWTRHQRLAKTEAPATPTPIYTAPAIAPVAPTPEGELAWEPVARAPLVTFINGDGVEDVFGFFRVWDGRSAWVAHAGAFDGATMKPLWQSEPLDPQLLKQPGIFPLAVVAGKRIVVADASPTLRVFDLGSGEKLSTLKVGGAVMDVCVSPDQPTRIWVKVRGGGDTFVDLATDKSDSAPRPKWCPELPYQREAAALPEMPTPKELAVVATRNAEDAACERAFENAPLAHAACRVPLGPAHDGFLPAYELTDGTSSVALGLKDEKPRVESRTSGSPWGRTFGSDDTKLKPVAPFVAELAFGRVYAVYERVYFDARLAALDARTGEVVWEAPLVGSLPGPDGSGRGEARGLVATATRLYVVRAGGGLDAFEASSGKPVGSIGKQ